MEKLVLLFEKYLIFGIRIVFIERWIHHNVPYKTSWELCVSFKSTIFFLLIKKSNRYSLGVENKVEMNIPHSCLTQISYVFHDDDYNNIYWVLTVCVLLSYLVLIGTITGTILTVHLRKLRLRLVNFPNVPQLWSGRNGICLYEAFSSYFMFYQCSCSELLKLS